MADVEIDLEISNPQELVGLGIRAYAIGDFSNAAAAFGRATQLMAEKHGDEDDSLGEIYMHYARSLLEVSREEAEPLGDAIPHGDESSDTEEDTEEAGSSDQNGMEKIDEDTEKDKEDDKKEDKKEDSKEEKKEVGNGDKMDTTQEDTPKKEDSKGDAKKEDCEVASKEEELSLEESTKEEEKTNGESSKEESSKAEDEEEEQQDNCTDLQLAWEVLEVAKKIFTKRGETGKDHLAETLILLGEVAMESENFQDGINDMKAGIQLQKELFEPTSRKLAESYYKLGIAHSTISNIEEAVESFNNSIEILKNRIKFLKESKNEKTEDGKSNRKNEEIEEMEKLIPEIEEKIADTKSIKEEMAAQLIKEMSGAGDNKLKTPTKDEAGSSKPKDISHLVKRKRKAEEETPESESQPAKKPTP